MAIKNYTTTIDVYKSLGEIQGALASHGARKIMVDYDAAGHPIGVMFGIETQDGPRGFALPANVEGVRAVFARQKVKATPGEAGQVQLDEVFLPYLTDGKGRTLYQLYQGGYLALGDGKEAQP